MKKFTLFFAALFVAFTAGAYTLNNPVGADGRYIVKWDVTKHAFAESNNVEVDETFVLAVDVKGTWLEDWLKQPATAEGASRGVACNNWTNYGDTHGDFRRLKQIDGTIWGVTCNFAQLMVNETEAPKAVMKDSVTYVYAQLFGFEYTSENPGAGWWMWGDNDVAPTQADGSDCLFAFAAYTGAKTSPALYADDFYFGDIYGFNITGYVAPCEASYYIFANDQTGWEKTTLYVWNGGDNNLQQLGGWPGSDPTHEVTIEGVNYKAFRMNAADGESYNFIFNNGGNGTQFADYTVTADQDYYVTLTAAGVVAGGAGVEDLSGDVVAVEYFSVLGTKLAEAPATGMFIRTMTLSNGKHVSEKVVRF